MKDGSSIDLGFATVELLKNGVVHIHFNGNYLISAKESKLVNDSIAILNKGIQSPILISAEILVQFDKSAREFSASEEGFRYTLAEALLVKNFGHKLIATFYVNYNKPPKPSKIFTNQQKAEEWLLSFK